MELSELKELLTTVKAEINKVIIGQDEVIDKVLITIFSDSHALIEGVPGVAKSLLVKTVGKVMDLENRRIQFTPDMMPADITGTNVFDMQKNCFKLVKGPAFTGFLLADEINRAPAKTQSALLQAMAEREITIDNETHTLSEHFTVFATQNPIEYEGTYPLPEAQKDRFLLKIVMDYPSHDEELSLAQQMMAGNSPQQILERNEVKAILNAPMLRAGKLAMQQVVIKDELIEYIVKIIRATRTHQAILVGAGPRATQSMILACRVKAVLSQRDFVTPDDVKILAKDIIGHRLVLRPEFEIEGVSVDEVVRKILEQVAIPR